MRRAAFLIFLLLLLLGSVSLASTTPAFRLATTLDANTPNISIGAPDVLHRDGWDRYLMYFSANSTVQHGKPSSLPPTDPGTAGVCGEWADRIWMTWSFGDGIAPSGWNADDGYGNVPPFLLLSPGGCGESALIGDPSVVFWQGKWHLYYEGTDFCDASQGRIFHATADSWFGPWTKQGMVTGLWGMTSLTGSGLSWPAVLEENGDLYLVFQDENQRLLCAKALDASAHHFRMEGWNPAAPYGVANPRPIVEVPGSMVSDGQVVPYADGRYRLLVTVDHEIREAWSTDKLRFPLPTRLIAPSYGEIGVSDPSFLRVAGLERVYYTRWDDLFHGSWPRGSINVAYEEFR